jgi:small subunit ribosomal protein S19
MARSLIKGPFVAPGVIRALKRFEVKKQMIKIWSRSSVILSEFVGKTVHVYNGKKFIPVSVSEAHVGRKFGEFSPSKVQAKHTAKAKVKGK